MVTNLRVKLLMLDGTDCDTPATDCPAKRTCIRKLKLPGPKLSGLVRGHRLQAAVLVLHLLPGLQPSPGHLCALQCSSSGTTNCEAEAPPSSTRGMSANGHLLCRQIDKCAGIAFLKKSIGINIHLLNENRPTRFFLQGAVCFSLAAS